MEKANKANNSELKSKIITAVVVVFLCLVFVVGIIWGLNNVLAMEGAFPPETDTHGICEAPEDKRAVAEMLNSAIAGALNGRPKTSTESQFSIDDDIKIKGSDELKKTVLFVKGNFEDALEERTEKTETDFSEDIKSDFSYISPEDIESYECKYFERNYVYQCSVCDAESDELLNGCPECGSTNLYEQSKRNDYVINIVLENTDSVIENNFAPRSDSEIKALLGDDLDEILNIDKLSVNYDKLELMFKTDRNTGELKYLEYKKDMTVKTEVTFVDKALGSTEAEFKMTEKVKNSFTWPSIALSKEEMVIEPKSSDNLTATLTCSDPTKPVVKWSSSDENIVKVDDEGYMKAGKEPGEAKITATFEFLGKTYYDSCIVSVRVPVESMKISSRKLKLNVGETKQLDAKVSPSDATVQTKTWYTEDEKIATVDENGKVTAVSSGIVTVYALSDDGYYKSSCEVTVK